MEAMACCSILPRLKDIRKTGKGRVRQRPVEMLVGGGNAAISSTRCRGERSLQSFRIDGGLVTFRSPRQSVHGVLRAENVSCSLRSSRCAKPISKLEVSAGDLVAHFDPQIWNAQRFRTSGTSRGFTACPDLP